MPTLRLGSTAPNFDAITTKGPINFHEWIGDSWVTWISYVSLIDTHQSRCQAILFSHPDDFTPVCTTELAEVSRRAPDFEKRKVKVIGLSANDLGSHERWIVDINEWGKTDLQFPIVRPLDALLVFFSHTLHRSPMPTGRLRRFMTCWTTRMRPTWTRRACPLL